MIKLSQWCLYKPAYLVTFCMLALSVDSFGKDKLPIPRFASIKLSEVNARSGPSITSSIEWMFIKKDEPVEITAEYDQWRQIRDIKNEGGWVHSSVLSGKRFVIINTKSFTYLFQDTSEKSQAIGKLNNAVRCQLHKCDENWCNVTCQPLKGWVLKNALWGVY